MNNAFEFHINNSPLIIMTKLRIVGEIIVVDFENIDFRLKRFKKY